MQRRTLLKLGLGSAAVLAVTGGTLGLLRPGLVDGHLTAASRAVFAGVARGVLEGSLPAAGPGRDAALDAHLARLDALLAQLPRATRAELSQLLALLASVPGRVAMTGMHIDWAKASVADAQQALESMRSSSIALRQQAYHALRDLTNAAYYADPSTWSLMGYPGPREL